MTEEMQEFMTIKEVAELLRVSVPTIERLVKDGLLKQLKMGSVRRYRRADVEQAIEKLSTVGY